MFKNAGMYSHFFNTERRIAGESGRKYNLSRLEFATKKSHFIFDSMYSHTSVLLRHCVVEGNLRRPKGLKSSEKNFSKCHLATCCISDTIIFVLPKH